MKPRLPHCLTQALLTTCATALTATSQTFADVPEGYTPVVITEVDQLADYTGADYPAFIIAADIANSTYRMTGAHQYWTDDTQHTHVLTFEEIESDSGGGALFVDSELVAEHLQELSFSQTTSSSDGGAIYGWGSSTIVLNDNESVTFNGNSAVGDYAYGGAIYAYTSSTITLSGNENVTFGENTASSGGAIYGGSSSTIKLNDNETVTFSGNTASYRGGAIANGSSSTITLSGNESVAFSGNSAASGGAIAAGILNLTENGIVTFSGNTASSDGGAISGSSSFTGNNSVTFKENSAEYGGAIFSSGTLNMTNNGSVIFSGNQVSSSSGTHCGGAIYMSCDSTANIASNDSVTFIGNSAEYGGAISSHSMSIIDFTNNGSVIFNGNSAECGGAISVPYSTVNLTGNDSVTFSGNSAKYSGGAIHANDASLNIAGNNHVEFRGNYEKTGSDVSATYRLRSVYVYGGTLELAAGEEQDITFFDTLYAGGGYSGTMEVSFNADYKDKDGVMQKATGDIIFSGKHAAEDLAALKPSYMQQELRDSLTSEVYAATNLYGGRLRIEDGAIYKGNGINVAADSGATLCLANGTLEQAGYDVVLESGTTLDLAGKNSITVSSLDMMDYSTLSFTVDAESFGVASLIMNGNFVQQGALTLDLTVEGSAQKGDEFLLMSLATQDALIGWDTSKITVVGIETSVDNLSWENGNLYFMYSDTPVPKMFTWNGAGSNRWNTVDRNWDRGEYSVCYRNGADVVFGDAGSGEVELVGELAPRTVLVDNSAAHDYAFTGEGCLTGEMQLTKEGDGTLTISTANGYTGDTIVNGGTVVVNNTTALGSGDVALNGAELHIARDATISGQITLNGENLLTVEDDCTLSLGRSIINNAYVEMQGAFDISSLSAEVLESGYTGGTVQGNGFAYSTHQVQVVENAYGAYAEMAGGTFLYNGIAGEAGYDGEVNVTTVDGSTFYVNKGTENLSKAYEQYEPTRFMMADETTLNMNVTEAQIGELEVLGSGRVTLTVTEDAMINTLMGGGEESGIYIKATGKTVTMGDTSSYTGSLTLDGGTISIDNWQSMKSICINDDRIDLRLGCSSFDNEVSDKNANIIILNGELKDAISLNGGDVKLQAELAPGSVLVDNSAGHDYAFSGEGCLTGEMQLTKVGGGKLTISTANDYTGGTVINGGTVVVNNAAALGSGTITVDNGTTLEMAIGNVLNDGQTVANSGNVIIHDTLASGTIDGGELTLAADFSMFADILDVDKQPTGNGFTRNGVMHVYSPDSATLSNDIDIVCNETHYVLPQLDNGVLITGGTDWNTYQLNGEAQYSVQAIMDYAAKNGGELKTISVNSAGEDGWGLSIENDTTTLKTSMLSGEHLSTFSVYMSGISNLTIDSSCAASFTTANAGTDSTITLEKDATVGSLVAADLENMKAVQLTIAGKGHTLKTDGLAVAFDGTLVLDEGVKVELLPDTCLTTLANANIVLKKSASLVMPEVTFATVAGGDEAKIVIISDDFLPMYDARYTEYSITRTRLTFNNANAFDLGNVVDSTSQVVNAGSGSMRDISTNAEYAELNAQGGNIYISAPEGTNERALAVGNLTLAEGRTVASMLGSNVTVTVNGTASFGSGAKLGAALTMVGGSMLDTANPVALQNHALSLAKGVNIGDDLWSTLTALEPEASTNIFTGVSALTLGGAEFTEDVDLSTIFTHGSLKAKKYILSYDAVGMTVSVTRLVDNNRYWKGGSGTWDYSTETAWTDEKSGGSVAAFASGYKAHFTAATGGTVTLGENVIAHSITVSGADYTFAGGEHTLTVTNSVEADSHKATFGMALTGENLALTATDGGTIALNAGGNSAKSVNIGTDSSVTVAATRSLAVADSFVNDGTLEAAGASITLSKGTAKGGNATVGTLNLTAGQSYTFGNLTAGTVSGAGADLTIGSAKTLTVTNNSTVATLTLGNDAAVAGDGTLATDGVTLQGDAIVTGKLSTAFLSGTGMLRIDGGSLTFTQTATLSVGLYTDGASTIMAGAGGTLTFSESVQNESSGMLTFVGSFDVGNCDTVDGAAIYVEGCTSGNGFKQAQRIVTIITDGVAIGTEATLSYKGKSIGSMDNKGQVTFHGDTDYSRFYVFSGTESLSAALNAAGGEAMDGIMMSSGTRLIVDRDMEAGFVTVTSGSATLDIAGGVAVSEGSTSRTEFKLTGSGAYSLANGNMGLGATLDSEGWHGTVALNHVANDATRVLNLNDYGHTGSTVRLNSVQGHFIAVNTVFNPTLELTGDGLEIVSCQSGRIYEFAGGVKGDGNLTYNLTSGYAHNQTYVFSGDVSEWTGAYESLLDKKTSTLKFISGATEMGAAILQTAGTVNVEVGNGQDEHTTAFKNTVEATKFTVKGNATAVIEGETRITGSMVLQGTLEVDGGSVALAENSAVQVGGAYSITGKGDTAPALSGNLEIKEAGVYGTGGKGARIDHSIIKLAENSKVEVSNVILGADSRLLDDPAMVLSKNMVIEGELGVNVEAGDVLTLNKESVMARMGGSGETVTLDKDSFACTFDITNVQDVRLTGDCLTIDISSMYPELKVLSAQYEWLGISLGDGDHAATVDENLMVEFILSDRLRARGYYLSSVGWGGTAVTIPVSGENVGIIYIAMYDVPEPATSTLSLLALAALAARRRRKN